MRTALPLIVLMSSPAAYAQSPQVTQIAIIDYGIYNRDVVGQQAAPGTVTGNQNVVNTDKTQLVSQTRTIPAKQGVSFGFHYLIQGTPAGASVQDQLVVLLPAAMTDPSTHQSSTQMSVTQSDPIGETSYSGYTMTNAWEVIPGTWTFQLWYQGQKLAEQSFTVQ